MIRDQYYIDPLRLVVDVYGNLTIFSILKTVDYAMFLNLRK